MVSISVEKEDYQWSLENLTSSIETTLKFIEHIMTFHNRTAMFIRVSATRLNIYVIKIEFAYIRRELIMIE